MRLGGKKVIVTGANRSIGKAVALLFAKEGAELAILLTKFCRAFG